MVEGSSRCRIMMNTMNDEMRKMSLLRNWDTADINQQNLTFSIVPTGIR